MPDLVAFISYILITTFTPGPNNILSMLNAGKTGLRKSMNFNLGIFFGFSIVMIISSIFSTLLLNIIPGIKPLLNYIGAAYIMWLAFKTFKSNYDDSEKNDKIYGIKEGLVLQFVNPKVILYSLTTLSTFIVPYYPGIATVLIGISLAGLAFIATICWALFGNIFQIFLKSYSKQVNIIMSLILVVTATTLII